MLPIRSREKIIALVPNSKLLPMAFAEYDKFLSVNKIIRDTKEAETLKRVGTRISIAAERWLMPIIIKDI